MDNKKISERLKKALALRGMTQADLAEITGYSTQYINYLMNGKREMNWDKAEKLSHILHVPASYIMGVTDTPAENPYYNANTLHGDSDKELILSFIHFLAAAGHSVKFDVIYYDDEYEYGETIEAGTIKEIRTDYPLCSAVINDVLISAGITAVRINDSVIPFNKFIFAANRICDYINYTLYSLNYFMRDSKRLSKEYKKGDLCELISEWNLGKI
jgi:transcriptional regulator with XRE-family HTH domain